MRKVKVVKKKFVDSKGNNLYLKKNINHLLDHLYSMDYPSAVTALNDQGIFLELDYFNLASARMK